MTEIESLDEDFLLRAAWVHAIDESVVLNARKRARLFNSQYLNDQNTEKSNSSRIGYSSTIRRPFKSTDGQWKNTESIGTRRTSRRGTKDTGIWRTSWRDTEDKVRVGKKVEYICRVEKCGKEYTSAQALLHHSKHGHIDYSDRPFKCEYDGCDKKYIYLRTLTDHIRRRHDLLSGEFPKSKIKQVRGNADFGDGLNPQIKQVDTADESQPETDRELERPFKCIQKGCNRAYVHSRTLAAHVKDRHSKSDENIHRCEVEGCDKSYRNRSSLNMHVKATHWDTDVRDSVMGGCDESQ
jgi:hypothetical protein